ncbi:MAG TPA: hypothetical protein VD813_06785 [Pseudonocardia sp.]|nr:hypothetical protein [Pseudonocardia sp.]
MQPDGSRQADSRQTTVTLGPFYLNRTTGTAGTGSVGVTAAVQFVGVAPDLDKAASVLRSRLTQLVLSNGLDGVGLHGMAERIFDSFVDPAWLDRNGLRIADHIRLRQLNVVATNPAPDAPSPVTVVTVSR